VDIILMLRILVVCPPSSKNPLTTIAVFGPLIIFKLARVAGFIATAVLIDQKIAAHIITSANDITNAPSLRGWQIATWVVTLNDNA
jgi:hypothetical protein